MNANEAIRKGTKLAEKFPVSMMVIMRTMGSNSEDLGEVLENLPMVLTIKSMEEIMQGALQEIEKYLEEVSKIPIEEMKKASEIFKSDPDSILNEEVLPKNISEFIDKLENN